MIPFFKYHSLENDFILVDGIENPGVIAHIISVPNSQSIIHSWCNRHRGIGADGILVLTKDHDQTPRIQVFNADGSAGQICLNGLRCALLHLRTYHNFDNKIIVRMDTRTITGIVHEKYITLNIGKPFEIVSKTIVIDDRSINGFYVDMGNPHFVINEPLSRTTLEHYGKVLTHHQYFPNGVNLGSLTQQSKDNTYELIVYERGCGITQACSSGAAAAMAMLYHTETIDVDQKIFITMPGGILTSWIDDGGTIWQEASAYFVFSASLDILNI